MTMYYYGPMMNGSDWVWEVAMMALWLAFFVVIAAVVARALRSHTHESSGRADPLDIAKERYAKGEITKEEFEQLRKDLK